MSSQVSTKATRQRISPRQAETVESLVAAALDELRASAYEGLTVRNVAKRAGVAPATAYNYFSSKDHLVTEVFSRRLEGLAELDHDPSTTPVERVAATLDGLAHHVAAEPELAHACTVAMLGADPEVWRLRERIGTQLHRLVAHAVGDGVDPALVSTIDLLVTGALVHAGMGHVAYDDLGSILADGTRRLLDGGA